MVLGRFAFPKVLRILRGKKHILEAVEECLPLIPDPDRDHDGFNRSKSGHGQWSVAIVKKILVLVEYTVTRMGKYARIEGGGVLIFVLVEYTVTNTLKMGKQPTEPVLILVLVE